MRRRDASQLQVPFSEQPRTSTCKGMRAMTNPHETRMNNARIVNRVSAAEIEALYAAESHLSGRSAVFHQI